MRNLALFNVSHDIDEKIYTDDRICEILFFLLNDVWIASNKFVCACDALLATRVLSSVTKIVSTQLNSCGYTLRKVARVSTRRDLYFMCWNSKSRLQQIDSRNANLVSLESNVLMHRLRISTYIYYKNFLSMHEIDDMKRTDICMIVHMIECVYGGPVSLMSQRR